MLPPHDGKFSARDFQQSTHQEYD